MATELFPNKKLKSLIIPLVLDQLLMVSVGMADTIMISSVGEAAVSGVSLVDNINLLVLTLFSGLSAGGAVLCAHYAGQGNRKEFSEVLKHMLLISTGISVIFTVLFLAGGRNLLSGIFGRVDEEVLTNGVSYLRILALSFVFMGIYSSCAAVFRGLGNSRIPMFVSLVMNVINIAGNAILLYGFKMGVEGVAIPTVVSRVVGAGIMIFLVVRGRTEVSFGKPSFKWNSGLVKNLLSVGVPGSLEMGIFQIGKILVLGYIARLGTSAITANAIANTLTAVQALPGDAIGLALMTVVGQCMGADNKEAAVFYTKKLLKGAYLAMAVINIIVILCTPIIVGFFKLSPDTAEITGNLIMFNGVFAMTLWPLSFTLPNALKGAYDVKYPLVVSMFSMWAFRVILSFIAINYFDASIYTLYMCFAVDWIFRAIMYFGRFKRRKWLSIKPSVSKV